MGEKEFNTNEVEEEMSLSGQLSRRRASGGWQRRAILQLLVQMKKMPTASGMHRRWKVFLIRIIVLTGQNM